MNVHSSNDRLSLFVRLNILFILVACSNPPTPSASQPVKTPTLPPTTTSTAISSPTGTPNPTEEFLATLQRDFPIDCDWGWGTTLLSPDGKYLACSSSGNIVVSSKDKTLRKTIQADSIPLKLPFPFYGIYLKPERWSTRNEYVYFSAQTDLGDGCDCTCDWNGIGVFRYNLTTDYLEEIISFESHAKLPPIALAFSFSNDVNQLATVIDSNRLVTINLATRKELSRGFSDYEEISRPLWSTDETKLALGLAKCPYDNPPTSDVGILDARDLSIITIISPEPGTNYIWEVLDWTSDNVLYLSGDNHVTRDFDYIIEIDLNSPNPVPVTPTP